MQGRLRMVVGVLEPHVILIYWPLLQLLQSPLSQPLSFHTKDLIIFKLPGHLNWSFNQELLTIFFKFSNTAKSNQPIHTTYTPHSPNILQ